MKRTSLVVRSQPGDQWKSPCMTFQDDVRRYVNQSHANAWRRAGAKAPDEPALVSSFLSRDMYGGLGKILRAWHGSPFATVSGIFTHQTPKVRLLTQTQSTEIADLMLVHQHFSVAGRSVVSTVGNALLLQAKRTGNPATGSVASGTAALQFELYRDWAPFVGVTRLPSSPLGSNYWDFRSSVVSGVPAPSKEGAYLTVFDKHAFSISHCKPQWAAPVSPGPAYAALATYPDDCTWSQGNAPAPGTPAISGVDCPVDFGTAFAQFLAGKRGRPFTPGINAGRDHWSIFVNLMLRESAKSSTNYLYNSSNQGIRNAPRGQTLLLGSVAPLLGHVAIEELNSFLAQELPARMENFAFTNLILRTLKIEMGARNADGPPEGEPGIFQEFEGGGHPPMLLVVTAGEKEPNRHG